MLMEITCDNVNRMGSGSLLFCRDTLLEGGAIAGFAVAMVDHPVPPPYKGIDDPMPQCIHRMKAAVRTLRAQGLRIPADVSVVGYDDIALSAWVDPPLTTIAQRTSDMGRWAVRRLGELIGRADGAATGDGSRMGTEDDGAGGLLGPPPVVLPVELRVRASTAAARESA